MENIMSTDYAFTPTASRAPVEKLPRKSSPNATTEKAKAGTKKAGKMPADSEVALSILQAAYEQFLETGARVRVRPEGGLTLWLMDVKVCGICQLWTLEKKCSACG